MQAFALLLLPNLILGYDSLCDTLFFADTGNWQIRAVNLTTKITTTLAPLDVERGTSSGSASIVRFYRQNGMAVSRDGITLYIADGIKSAIRSVNISSGYMSTLSNIELATGVAVSTDGSLYVSSTNESKGIYKIMLPTGVVSVLAGGVSSGFQDGSGSSAKFMNPCAISLSHNEKSIHVADDDSIRTVSLDSAAVSTLLRNYSRSADGSIGIVFNGIVASGDGEWVYATAAARIPPAVNCVVRVGIATGEVVILTSSLDIPLGIAVSPNGGTLYVSDSTRNQIVAIDLSTRNLSILSGQIQEGYKDGLANETLMYWPYALALSPPCVKPVRPASNHLLPPSKMGQGPCEQPTLSWKVVILNLACSTSALLGFVLTRGKALLSDKVEN